MVGCGAGVGYGASAGAYLNCGQCGSLSTEWNLNNIPVLIITGEKYQYCSTCGVEVSESIANDFKFREKWERAYGNLKKTIRKWDYTNLQTTLVNCASVKGSPVPAINHQGILHCMCGRVKVVRRKDNKSIRSFWKAIVFLSTEGYTCPDCKTVFYGVRASTQTIKRWKSKYPEEDWGRMNIVEK